MKIEPTLSSWIDSCVIMEVYGKKPYTLEEFQRLNNRKTKHKFCLPEPGSDSPFYSKSGLMLCRSYNRVVIGDRGPYVEIFHTDIILDNFHVPKQENWRLFSNVSYYIEMRSNCASNVKLYVQQKEVAYADYVIGMCYISPSDLINSGRSVIIEKQSTEII